MSKPLALVTGLAHYLKALIRISLTDALKLEREHRECEALKSFRTELGTTIIFVEQNLDTIMAIAQRCYIMEKGKITRSLTGEDVNAENVRAQLLL